MKEDERKEERAMIKRARGRPQQQNEEEKKLGVRGSSLPQNSIREREREREDEQ
jgi:hypothetical protein